jgi:hypothetical protein
MERGNDPKMAMMLERIQDYARTDFTKRREQLVELWRQHHPEAAKEASAALHPLILHFQEPHLDLKKYPRSPDEIWINDIYQVSVRRGVPDRMFRTEEGIVQIGINTHEGTARHDWRDFQAIKNQLAGAECEAFELYPAESRLLDPSNYYTLWCFPGLRRIRVGNEERDVRAAEESFAPQRDFPREKETG